jgi:alkaline phosphatase D
MKPAYVLAALLASACAAPAVPVSPAKVAAAPSVQAPPALSEESASAAAAERLPIRGDGPQEPTADKPLTRIAIGSCSEETEPLPILGAVATLAPDLFLYVGDNVYGDAKAGDMSLPELKQAYADLSMNAHFSAFNMATPILATWDDHDYGVNDGGGDFAGKERAERLFETFWRDAALGGQHPGIYGSRTYGPPGQRVQVIMLDTRFFRSPLRRSDTPDASGYRPYLPDADPSKTMLGEAQWAWLEAELRRPAEIRLLVSSIQILAEGHPFEAWKTLPSEQARLYRTIRESGARGLVLVSGDRHVAALYRRAGVAPYPLHEITASSLNQAHVRSNAETGPHQLGPVYTPANFGLVEIDWAARRLDLTVRGMDGAPQRQRALSFADIGLPPRVGAATSK